MLLVTAHRVKPTITPERVEWFALYVLEFPSWGSFHVSLDDGNFECGGIVREGDDDDVREALTWFASLSPSQRRRLGNKAEMRALALRKAVGR